MNYFVFCNYDSSYPHQALFVPLDNLDSDMTDKMNKLINLGNKIQNCHKKTNYDDVFEHEHYKNGDKIYDDKVSLNIINSWLTLLAEYDMTSMDVEMEVGNMGQYMYYYINDENRYNSPNELYDFLLGLTEFQDRKISVKNCVMISSIKFDTVVKVTLRFFAEYTQELKQESKQELKSTDLKLKLLKDDRFYDVTCATKDNDVFAGYGYIRLTNKTDYDVFNEKCFKIDDDILVFFK